MAVLSLSMGSRLLTALIFAVIGAALALLDHRYIAEPNVAYIPQTQAGWIAFYLGLCAPWAILGAVVGFVVGRRTKAKS
jgi:hypothetical protein